MDMEKSPVFQEFLKLLNENGRSAQGQDLSLMAWYLDGRAVLNCADRTAAQIDEVVKRMLQDAYTEAKELLSCNMDALHKIAAFLIKKETITGKEFMEIYHQVQKEREEDQEAKEEQAGDDKPEIEIENPESSNQNQGFADQG